MYEDVLCAVYCPIHRICVCVLVCHFVLGVREAKKAKTLHSQRYEDGLRKLWILCGGRSLTQLFFLFGAEFVDCERGRPVELCQEMFIPLA